MRTAKETLKKILGVILVIVGVIALLTPLTPGSWLAFIGLELLGLRYLFQEKIERFLKKRKKNNEDNSKIER